MFYEGMEFGSYDKAENTANKAFEFYEDGQMSQALEELDTAIEINPANGCWHFDKALALDAIHRYEEAIDEFEIALQLSPGDLEILNSLAVDYTRTGQYDRAITTFEQIEELDPKFEPCYCNRIIAYTEMGLHDLAEQMFYLAQQINPACALCYYNIGNSLYVRGEYRQAIGCWSKTAELESTHPQIHYRIAQANWALGGYDLAREAFLAELRTNPGDVDVIVDYGLMLLEQGDVESAKEKFRRVLEFSPKHAVALFHLGEIAFHDAETDRALDLFNQALQSDDTLSGPYYRLAHHALTKGQYQKARAYLISELRNTPDHPQVLVSMGSMFLKIAQQSQDISAGSKSNQSMSRYTGRSDMDHATHCFLRALEADDCNVQVHYYLGLTSAMKGLWLEASQFFSHSLDIQADHVPSLRDSAIVLRHMGMIDQAVERVRVAQAAAKSDPFLRRLGRQLWWAAMTAKAQRLVDRSH